MAEKKKKRLKLSSPKGVFKYPRLNEPDYGTDEYPKKDGEYSIRLILVEGDPATQAFIERLQPLYEDALAEAQVEFDQLPVASRKKHGAVKPNDLYQIVYDDETEEPTGQVEFKFAMKATGEIKRGPKAGQRWESSPTLFDASGKPMIDPPSIWGGTEGVVGFEPRPYFVAGTAAAGLKLALEAVQVIDLVSAGQRDAAAYGFQAVDGYEHQTKSEAGKDAAEEDEDVSAFEDDL